MADLTGSDLEDHGQKIFTRIGVVCIHRLKHVRLLDLDPSGSYSSDEHLELDYLIPYDGICLLGEITARKNSADIKRKYQRFRQHFNIINRLKIDDSVWRSLGVHDKDLRYFRNIKYLKGFFITRYLQKFDVNLGDIANISCFYKRDWEVICEYSQTIGTYAKYHFIHHFEVIEQIPRRALTLNKVNYGLMRTDHKKIASGDIGLADLYTFEASPYELLPLARVYRRDELPSLSSALEPAYQRPIIPGKLDSIREKLLASRDFMFPNSILVVLSNDCKYLPDEENLTIPEKYGAISIIDGQHRLLSYADENVKSHIGDDSKIMVTAIHFPDVDVELIHKYSARAFVEINMNQTRIHSSHLDAIAYEILGDTHSRAIAAQVILLANQRVGKIYGLFDTNQTGLGIIRSTTVLLALKAITNLNKIDNLKNVQRGIRFNERRGYENLFGVPINELSLADNLISRGVVCIEHYFNLAAKIFLYDWPQREKENTSSLKFAKMIAGFIKLLQTFISEGLDWKRVEEELKKIQLNVMALHRMNEYKSIIFDPSHQDIPNAEPSADDDYRFLNLNRHTPTSINNERVQRFKR